MAYIVMAFAGAEQPRMRITTLDATVRASREILFLKVYSHGLCSHGLCSHDLCSYDLYSHGRCHCGPDSDYLCSYGLYNVFMAYVATAYVVIAHIVVA